MNKIYKNIVYDSPIIKIDNKEIKLLYADYIASGKLSPIIEKYLIKNIYPYYANTHSNAYCGILMKNYLIKTRNYIKTTFNLNGDHVILFKENTTQSINHLSNLIDYTKYNKVYIFTSSYEHYSNLIPWIEMKNSFKNVNVIVLNHNNDFTINYNELNKLISKVNNENNLIIITMSMCSNVTGIKTDLNELLNIKNKYLNVKIFLDYACSAPYVNINCDNIDAISLSMHKFIGSPYCGLLIVKKNIFMKNIPFIKGGGCINTYKNFEINYSDDIEKRESAGTPNIINIIKTYKTLQLKQLLIDYIINNEKLLYEYSYDKFNKLVDKYNNFHLLFFNDNNKNIDRLPIFCVYIDNIHYNLLVVLLNDLFGIQTRGGIACSAIIGDIVKENNKIDGWCRISIHWLMNYNDIDYIISSLEHIIINYINYIDKYKYNSVENLFIKK